MRKLSERLLNDLARLVANRPVWTIVVSIVFCLFFGWHIKDLRFDATTEGLLLSDDPWLVTYNDFLDRYGRDEWIIIAIETDEVFKPETIDLVRRIHKRIESEVPYISRVDSIVSARDTRGEGDLLIVGELFDSNPQTPEEYGQIKERAFKNPFYINRLIDADSKVTAIVARSLSRVSVGGEIDDLDVFAAKAAQTQPLSDAQNGEIVGAIKAVVDGERGSGASIKLLGSPVITEYLKRSMENDIRMFIVLLIATIVVMLFAFFRRISGVICPLFVVILSLVTMLGLMAWLGIPVKMPTQVMPTLLLAIGVGACVHLLAVFYRLIDRGGERKETVISACEKCFFPIMMTALTTIAGLGSFVTAKIDPFVNLGIFAPFGVLVCTILTFTLLPALLAIVPVKRRQNAGGSASFDRLLIWIASLSERFPKRIVVFSAISLAAALSLLSQARLSHYMLGWFPKNSEIRIATNTLDEKMRGTVTLEVLIDFGEENALYDPKIMNDLDEAIAQAKRVSPVGKVLGVPTIVKEINRALNENDDRFYVIPDSRGAIAEELLLFGASGSADLDEVLNSDYSQTRITHKTPFLDAIEGRKTVEELERLYTNAFPNAKVEVTGLIALVCRVLSAAVESTAISYTVVVFVITAMMIFSFGSLKLGLFSMIPNLIPVIIGMAYMVLVSIPFDMFVMLVGAIVLGLIVDDTIHFIHNFKSYYSKDKDAVRAIRKSMLGVGKAMMITSLVLSVGFSVYLFAFMQNIVNFGMIAGFCIILAMIADFLLTPALLILWTRRRQYDF
ncbi:MAG: MMPL family transporter [Helicobacteraceae bacterium]|jgi:predicted RND superfamily exporter protein|nr:MMPL family transporter [Helicobacteraceae bacterium]